MFKFILRRLVLVFFTIWVMSILSFAVIQLPPGDMVTKFIEDLEAGGGGSAPISVQGHGEVAMKQGAMLREINHFIFDILNGYQAFLD